MNSMPEPTHADQQINDSGFDPATVRAIARQIAAAGFDIDPSAEVPALIDRINELLAEGCGEGDKA